MSAGPAVPPGAEPSSSAAIIGAALRAAREARHLDVAAVSDATRIRAGLVRAIEAGDLAACGGAVYARGHIRNISAVVGADADALVASYDRAHSEALSVAVTATADLILPDPLARRELRHRRGTNWTALMAIAAGVITLIAGISFVVPGSRAPTSPVAAGAAGPPAAAASDAPVAVPTTPPPNALAFGGVTVQVRLGNAASWFHVVDDTGTVLFQGVLAPGTAREFRASRRLSFVIGNAGAVDLVVNGRDLGAPGANGQVVSPTFGPGDPGSAQG